MDFVIFYFSGTGNTELIAEEIKRRLKVKGHSVEMYSIEDRENMRNISLKGKILGFGFPVYKFTYPDIFNDVFPLIGQNSQDNKYFLFSTYARFTAESFYDFSKQLDKKGWEPIAEESFKAPSCGISARKPESDFEYQSVMFFEDEINFKLDRFISRVVSAETPINSKIERKHSILNRVKLKMVKDIEKTKYPKLQIDKKRCSLCGLCASKCPEQNLKKTDTHIEIEDEFNCLHCLRCMNHCPSNAIIFGKLTVGEYRYTIKLRNQLFEKALSGYREKYWENFETVIRQWRKNTIKYWISHRKNPEIY